MRTALVLLAALLVMSFAAPAASAGPNCPAVQPWWGICNNIVKPVLTAQDAAEELLDQLPDP